MKNRIPIYHSLRDSLRRLIFLRLRIKCMRNLPVLLFESVSLFFLLDFSPQLAVDAVFSASALILQAVLDDTSHVSEQAERGNRRRPVSVDTNAVDELCCVLIAMLGGKMKIVHRLN